MCAVTLARKQIFIRELTALAVLLVSLFQTVVASFLSVFVPQKCERVLENNSTRISSECSFEENLFININDFNLFVLVVNGVTCVFLWICLYVEWRREVWIIERFDVNETKGSKNLRTELSVVSPTNPSVLSRQIALREGLGRYNLWYRRLFVAFSWLFSFNCLISGVLVFHFYYQDYRSATTFLSSIALVVSRVYYSLYTASDCLANEKAECTNLSVPLSFNVIKAIEDGSSQLNPVHASGNFHLGARAGRGDSPKGPTLSSSPPFST